jgi:hypothetical protein
MEVYDNILLIVDISQGILDQQLRPRQWNITMAILQQYL